MDENSQQEARKLEQILSTLEKTGKTSILLTIALNVAVSVRVLEFIKRGGPTNEDLERARTILKDLGERGTDLYFRSNKEGATADRFEQVADAIAVLSFCPGGIVIFGKLYESFSAPEKSD